MKTDNEDAGAVDQMRRAIAEAEGKMTILKRDRLVLTAKINSLDRRIRGSHSAGRSTAVSDCTEEAAELSVSDSDHVL